MDRRTLEVTFLTTLLHRLDKLTNSRENMHRLLDREIHPAVVHYIANSRAEHATRNFDEGEPPDVIVGFEHRVAIAHATWVDGFLAGAMQRRIADNNGDDGLDGFDEDAD